MFTYKYSVCAILIIAFCWKNANSLEDKTSPSSLPSFEAKSPHLNERLKNFLQDAIKRSKKGSSQYSIPPLDPYYVPKITMSPNKNLGINIEMKDVTSHGFSTAVLNKVKADPAKGRFEILFVVPVSTLLSNYNLTGKVFNIPINGQGKSNITFYDAVHEMKIQGMIVKDQKESHKRFVVSTVNLKLKPKKMKFRFENLFKENKDLGDVVNKMMNDNWKEIFLRIQPNMEEVMAKHLYRILRDFFLAVPFNKLFPDI